MSVGLFELLLMADEEAADAVADEELDAAPLEATVSPPARAVDEEAAASPPLLLLLLMGLM